jgi:hypothetical protein
MTIDKLKKILSYLPIYHSVFAVYDMFTRNWSRLSIWITLLLTPILLVTVIFNICLLLLWFIFWYVPDSFYFPFITGGFKQMCVDRFLLTLGFFLIIDDIMIDRWS